MTTFAVFQTPTPGASPQIVPCLLTDAEDARGAVQQAAGLVGVINRPEAVFTCPLDEPTAWDVQIEHTVSVIEATPPMLPEPPEGEVTA